MTHGLVRSVPWYYACMHTTGASGAVDREPAGGRALGVLIDGKFLAAERKRLGYSQDAFCAEFGLTRKVIKDIESNPQKRVQPQTLAAIAAALGVQPRALTRGFAPARLLTTSAELVRTNLEIVGTAKEFIHATGSRSRDNAYLGEIERAVETNPSLAYFRILFETPISPQMVKHLRRILEIRNAGEEPRETISLGIYANTRTYPSEATICMNERMALFVLPSIHGAWGYDTAMVFEDPIVIAGWRRWIEEMYRAGEPIKTAAQLAKLERANH